MEETVAKINPGLLDTGHLDKALSQHFYITFYLGLFGVYFGKIRKDLQHSFKKTAGGTGGGLNPI